MKAYTHKRVLDMSKVGHSTIGPFFFFLFPSKFSIPWCFAFDIVRKTKPYTMLKEL